MINNIKMIELEINKHCNRKCSWCPNSKIDRSGIERFPMELLIPLLDELRFHHFGQNWYGGFISFSRNNEPFADYSYLQSVTELIKGYLPYVNLVSNTNGDFIHLAMESQIDEISIMDYDCRGYEDWRSYLETYFNLKFQYKKGNIIYMTGPSKKVAVCLDWPKETLMENRGGFFEGPVSGMQWREFKQRVTPCNDPGSFVAIDYNGSVMPCCCVRSDHHKDVVLGNLHADTLDRILRNDKAVSFRNAAANIENLPDVCKYCHKGIGRYMRDFPSINYSDRYQTGGEE